jgi:hypothetical protein
MAGGHHTIAMTQLSSQGLSLLVWRLALQASLLIKQIINHHVADQVNPVRLMPSRFRLSTPEGSVTKTQSLIESVTMRLISSGICRSPLRRPASTWATSICNFFATNEQATVELTSLLRRWRVFTGGSLIRVARQIVPESAP